jgi:hypothetical protein
MSLENNIAGEISQRHKDKYCMIYLHELSRICKSVVSRGRLKVTMGWDKGKNGGTMG